MSSGHDDRGRYQLVRKRRRMDIAVVQVASPDDEQPKERIERVAALLDDLGRPDLVVLPELWSAGYFNFERYAERSETLDGPTVSMCRAVAQKLQAHVHIGSIIEAVGGGMRNTAVLIRPDGTIAHQYSKIHVFGYQSLEAELLTPGDALPVTRLAFGWTASTTCYDLRFPGLWEELSARGAEIAIVPAAWPATRLAHWQLFTSARAVEHQLLMITCNAAGEQRGVQAGGHSRVVAPTGEVLAEAGTEEEVLRVTFDPAIIANTRAEFPVIADRLGHYEHLRSGS